MQPGRARTSGLGAPPLLLARWVGCLAPVRPIHGVLVLSYPSAALGVHVCAGSWATWLLFASVPARCVVFRVRRRGPLGSCSPVCPRGLLCCFCGVLGRLAPVHQCARSVRCFECAVSWATWLLFTGVPARFVLLRLRCPGPIGSCPPVRPLVCCFACVVPWPLGSCSPVCPLGVLCCLCVDLGHLAPNDRCARPVLRLACAVSRATWLLFNRVPARCVVLRVRCPGPLGSCSPVRPLGALLCLCGVLGHLAPVHGFARSVRCVACTVFWATLLLFTGVSARCVMLSVRCPGPLGSCSPVCPLGVQCWVCRVLGHLAPLPRCARSVCCVACAVSWAPRLLFTGVPTRCVVLRARCPGPLGCCSPVCSLGVLCCLSGVLGHLAPVLRCARLVCYVACTVSWPLGSCSPVCSLSVLCWVCGVLGHLAPVHQCARWVCCALGCV